MLSFRINALSSRCNIPVARCAGRRAASRAFELIPSSHSIQHTQAEIARRLANETDDPLRKLALRRITRQKLGGPLSRLSEYDLYTRARLAIDEFREL